MNNPMSGPSLSSQPIFRLIPAYISSAGVGEFKIKNITDTKEMSFLALNTLNQENWNKFEEKEKKEIIENQKIIYLKLNNNNQVVEIGIHLAKCKTIQILGITRIVLGNILLPENTSVVAMPVSSYNNMIKNFLPTLKKNN